MAHIPITTCPEGFYASVNILFIDLIWHTFYPFIVKFNVWNICMHIQEVDFL